MSGSGNDLGGMLCFWELTMSLHLLPFFFGSMCTSEESCDVMFGRDVDEDE